MPILKKSIFEKTTILTNEFLQNKEITLAAKGLLAYMLSLPNDWDFTIKNIATQTGTSEYQISKLLQELEANGYHTKKHIYENGRIKDWVYYIFAEPRQDIINKTFSISTFEQEFELQDVELQDVENDPLYKCISNYNKLDIQNNNTKEIYIQNNNVELKESSNNSIITNNIKCIIDYLNKSINANYKFNSKETVKLIKARFNEGYVLDDFYDVIDNKVKEWINNPEMCMYLRPKTLFGNKFESYLNQKSFKGTVKTDYSSKPKTREKNTITNSLARDKNGDLLEF